MPDGFRAILPIPPHSSTPLNALIPISHDMPKDQTNALPPSTTLSQAGIKAGQNGSSVGWKIRLDTLTKIKTALEKAGIEFIAENGGGAGVRLRKAQR